MSAALDLDFDLDTHDDALEPHRGVEFHEMPVRQILNRCTNPKMSFRWTINPYRGCEFGCVYCYARYTHDFLELRDPMDFERRIFVKRMAAEVLARTLSRTPIGDDSIAIGTATDPYQPAERKFGLTRAMLEVFAQLSGLHLSITTKSTLVARDIDLIARINQRSKISVNFSCITLNPRLARVLEPRAPRPELRMRTLAMLAKAGIHCDVLMMPMIPGLTDSRRSIESVIVAAREAGAKGVWWRPLFLQAGRRAPLPSVHAREISRAGAADRCILFARGLRADRLRESHRRDHGSVAHQVRLRAHARAQCASDALGAAPGAAQPRRRVMPFVR